MRNDRTRAMRAVDGAVPKLNVREHGRGEFRIRRRDRTSSVRRPAFVAKETFPPIAAQSRAMQEGP